MKRKNLHFRKLVLCFSIIAATMLKTARLKPDIRFLLFNKLMLIFYLIVLSVSISFSQTNDKYYLFKNNYPNNKSVFWGDNDALTNGVTHDNNNWYFTTLGVNSIGECLIPPFCVPGKPNGNWSIRRIPVGQDLVTGAQSEEWIKSNEPALANYGHAGDLDCFRLGSDYYLAVPITGGPHPAIAFFSTNPIKYINYAYVNLNSYYDKPSIGWCAVNPADGDLYTSHDDADFIFRYKINWVKLFAPFLNPNLGNYHDALSIYKEYPLKNKIRNMQGGEFTPTGSKLYISCGVLHEHFNDLAQNPEDGIHVFNTSNWEEVKRSTNRYPGRGRPAEIGCFDYSFDNNKSIWSDEPEGLTIWDLDDGRSPNTSGQLHVLLYHHGYPGTNSVSLKHYQRMDEYDECFSAKKLSPCNKIIASNDCATKSNSIPPITEYSGNIKDVWFTIDKYNSPSFSIETSQVSGGLTHTVMQVLAGSCGNLREIASNNGNNTGGHAKVTISNYTGSWPLYVRVTDYGGNNTGQFGIYYRNMAAGSDIFTGIADTLGDGNGIFQRPTLTGDVNGDGKTDLIFPFYDARLGTIIRTRISNGNGPFKYYADTLGDGNGIFQRPTLSGDVNGDGKTDLIFPYYDARLGAIVRTKMSNGNGTFKYYADTLGDGNGIFQNSTLTGDVNGDGKTDLIFPFYDARLGTIVRTRMSNGNGTYKYYADTLGDGNGIFQNPTLTGDVNGDGKTDLIFPYYDARLGAIVRTKMSNGNGTFKYYADTLGDGNGIFQNSTLTGDVNGDGKTDLIFPFYDARLGTIVRTRMSNGNGTYKYYADTLGDGNGIFQYPTLTGDVNGDGKTDLIFVGQDWVGCGLNIRIKLSKGNGKWCADWQTTGDGNGMFQYPTLTGDVNGDGKTDLMFLFYDNTLGTVLRTKIVKAITSCNTQGNIPLVQIQKPDAFTAYPNPTNGMLQLRADAPGEFEVSVFDLSKRLMLPARKFSGTTQLELSSFANGIYLVEIYDIRIGERVVKKVVKIK